MRTRSLDLHLYNASHVFDCKSGDGRWNQLTVDLQWKNSEQGLRTCRKNGCNIHYGFNSTQNSALMHPFISTFFDWFPRKSIYFLHSMQISSGWYPFFFIQCKTTGCYFIISALYGGLPLVHILVLHKMQKNWMQHYFYSLYVGFPIVDILSLHTVQKNECCIHFSPFYADLPYLTSLGLCTRLKKWRLHPMVPL